MQELPPILPTSSNQVPVERRLGSSEQFDAVYANFEKNIEKLAAQFSCPKTTIIKSLIDNTCEFRARYEIEFPNYSSGQKFDSYFSIRHEFGKNKFVQRLAVSLRHHGIQAHISTEEKRTVGVFDVLITNTKFLVTVSDKSGKKKIVIEWKAGASFSLSQLERYLWVADVVVLVRPRMKQVLRIARTDVEEYLKRSLVTLAERALLISSTSTKDSLPKIPGQYCKGCPATDCHFHRHISNEDKIVSFGSESMTEDLLSVFNNIESCIDEAVNIVVAELINVGGRS